MTRDVRDFESEGWRELRLLRSGAQGGLPAEGVGGFLSGAARAVTADPVRTQNRQIKSKKPTRLVGGLHHERAFAGNRIGHLAQVFSTPEIFELFPRNQKIKWRRLAADRPARNKLKPLQPLAVTCRLGARTSRQKSGDLFPRNIKACSCGIRALKKRREIQGGGEGVGRWT